MLSPFQKIFAYVSKFVSPMFSPDNPKVSVLPLVILRVTQHSQLFL